MSGIPQPTPERIEFAAIMARGESEATTLPRPARHHDIIAALAARGFGPGDVGPSRQGFVTSTGRYVGREEAWRIAVAAGQLLPARTTDGMEVRRTAPAPNGSLYSEDVW